MYYLNALTHAFPHLYTSWNLNFDMIFWINRLIWGDGCLLIEYAEWWWTSRMIVNIQNEHPEWTSRMNIQNDSEHPEWTSRMIMNIQNDSEHPEWTSRMIVNIQNDSDCCSTTRRDIHFEICLSMWHTWKRTIRPWRFWHRNKCVTISAMGHS